MLSRKRIGSVKVRLNGRTRTIKAISFGVICSLWISGSHLRSFLPVSFRRRRERL